MQLEKEKKLTEEEAQEENLEKLSLVDLLKELHDEYFSDLQPEEIPNSEVSDISDCEI